VLLPPKLLIIFPLIIYSKTVGLFIGRFTFAFGGGFLAAFILFLPFGRTASTLLGQKKKKIPSKIHSPKAGNFSCNLIL